MKGFSTGARGALNALDLARAKNRLGRHVIIRAERARKSLAFQWQRQCGAFVERHLGQRLAHAEPQSRDTPRCPASIVIHAESVNRGEPMKPTDRRIWPRHWVCLAAKIGFAPRQMVLRGTELVGSAEYSQVNSPKCRQQSALQSVKGVKEAKVSLEKNEAVVTHDPDVVKVEDLIKAVKSARGMSSYDAKIKKK